MSESVKADACGLFMERKNAPEDLRRSLSHFRASSAAIIEPLRFPY
jgi:hypothetical protein